MFRLINYIFILLGFFLHLSIGHAENYKFATSVYPPFQYLEDGKPKGYKLDILNEAFKRAGHTYEIEFLPWARVLKYIENGNVDFTTGEWKRSRTDYANYSEVPLFNSTISLFTNKDRNIAYAGDLTRLKDYAIITVNKYSYGRSFNKAIDEGILTNIYSTPTPESSVAMLQYGRGDILISNRHLAIAIARNAGHADNLLELTPPISINPTHIIYSKEKDLRRLARQIDQALQSMIDDGTMATLNNY